jgi:MoxR-like ATPase
MNVQINILRENIAKVYYGPAGVIDRAICCLLARGHLLIEDVPGVGKTVLATSIARSIDCSFSRIQLTPDMLPSDIVGTSVFDRNSSDFIFRPGPIFANIVLADEVNRTPPRTQAALLEAMSESTVSVDGVVKQLPLPFMVIATQNPCEFEGTYALPENQLDRFLMRISLGYPSPADETRVLSERPGSSNLPALQSVLHAADVQELQSAADRIHVHDSLLDYIVRFANATRKHADLLVGLSPRGSLALTQSAKATALYRGRDHVIPQDITDNIRAVCAHRLIPRGGVASGRSVDQILMTVRESVPLPL